MGGSQALDEFWPRLALARQPVLLLDYDGTLAPFRVERDQAVPYPGIRELLNRVQQETTTRLVIISGRSIADLLPLLGMFSPPEIWGCHGWEHLPLGATHPRMELPQTAAVALCEADEWLVTHDLDSYVERKPASLAIHWRGLPEARVMALRNMVTDGWQPFAEQAGLVIHPFNGGLELRCPGQDKGTAIRSILDQVSAGEPVAFLGDDLTDEDGFVALSGRGLGVLVCKEERTTEADVRIRPPEELLEFLQAWLRSAPRSHRAMEENA